VVFDRIREELKLRQKRESYEVIINSAINKTLSRTLLTGVTTLLVLASLFFAGGDVLHDFSWVLLVGIVVGTYSSIFVAAPLLVEWQKRVDLREAAKSSRAA
jgi:preprotein translocase SecF subunit